MQRRHWLLLIAALALLVPTGAALAGPSDSVSQPTAAAAQAEKADKGEKGPKGNACPPKSKRPGQTPPPGCGQPTASPTSSPTSSPTTQPPTTPPPGIECDETRGEFVFELPPELENDLVYVCAVLAPAGEQIACDEGEVPIRFEQEGVPVFLCVVLGPNGAPAGANAASFAQAVAGQAALRR